MFFHNFKNSLKVLFKNKSLIFWTFAFPIVLGILFNMSFSNIEKSEKLSVIDIGIVNDDNYKNNQLFTSAFDYLSDKNNENRLFNITYDSIDELNKKIDDDSIIGYLYLDNEPHIVVSKNGIDQTIFKYVTDEIYESSIAFSKIDISSLEDITNTIAILFNSEVNINNTTSDNLSYTMIEFYSLIAMTCLYGGILSMYSLNQVLPNMTNKGKRVSISPSSKTSLILSSLLASLVAQVIGVMLLFTFSIFILNVDFGSHILLVLLLTFCGSLAGLALGTFVSTYFKGNEMSKLGIIIAISMIFSFLSGMMGITMKYVIDKNLPIINKINPVNMVTDGLYSLYYYETFDRFIFYLVSLLIFSGILLTLSFLMLRRQKYDNI